MVGIAIAALQPYKSLIVAARGMKIKVPVAVAPVINPITRPCLSENHLEATTEDNCIAVKPGPIPSKIPIPNQRCHFSVVKIEIIKPIINTNPDNPTIRRGPYFSIKPPANGAERPKSANLKPVGAAISPIDQPRSFDIGTIKTLGTPTDAVANRAEKKAKATIIHP